MNGTTLARFALPMALAALLGGCSANRPAAAAGAQLTFGIEMARRGLWNEALFRFERARLEQPGDVRAANNLAVAYEAVGRFDEALAAYRAALTAEPGNRVLKQNYSRFLEFYQAFKPKKPAAAAAGGPAPQAPGQSPPKAPEQSPPQAPDQSPPKAPEQSPPQAPEPPATEPAPPPSSVAPAGGGA